MAQIGFLLSLQPLVGVITPPVFASTADRTGKHAKFGLFLPLLGAIFAIFIFPASSMSSFLLSVVLIVVAIARTPIPTFLDAAAMAVLKDCPEKYGQLRLFGSLGFGSSSFSIGILVKSFGFEPVFGLLFTSLMVLTSLALFRVFES